MDVNDDKDQRKDLYSEGDDLEIKRPIDMTVPERIVLSAGYDGDDNEDDEGHNADNFLHDDQPLQPPDVLMVGMHTPPSTLTIDHSDATYARSGKHCGCMVVDSRRFLKTQKKGSSRAQAGDGSATSHPQYQTLAMLTKQYQDTGDSDDESRLSNTDQFNKMNGRMELVGREEQRFIVNREMSISQLQRRVRMLENELIDTQRSQSLWKMALLALTFINPILITYFMRKR